MFGKEKNAEKNKKPPTNTSLGARLGLLREHLRKRGYDCWSSAVPWVRDISTSKHPDEIATLVSYDTPAKINDTVNRFIAESGDYDIEEITTILGCLVSGIFTDEGIIIGKVRWFPSDEQIERLKPLLLSLILSDHDILRILAQKLLTKDWMIDWGKTHTEMV